MSDGTATLIILLAVGLLLCAARIQAAANQTKADRCREAEALRAAIKKRRHTGIEPNLDLPTWPRPGESNADFKQRAASADLTAAIDCDKD